MDKTDFEILEILRQDSRMSYSDIAEKVHLSRVAVRERIETMKRKGIIRKFTVVIDAKAYQKFASVFLDIDVEPHKLESVAKVLVNKAEVAIVSQHTGNAGLHVHVYIASMSELSHYLEEHIFSIDGVKQVHSYVLIKQYKTNPYIARYSDTDEVQVQI